MQDGQARELFLVGGVGSSSREWSGAVARLGPGFRGVPVERDPGAGMEVECGRLAGRPGGRPASVLGHSGGAIVALEAALRAGPAGRVAGLVLYEPPVLAGHDRYRQDALAGGMRSAIRRGDRAGAAEAFLRSAAGLSAGELEAVRGSPRWAGLAESAEQLLAALEASHRYRFRPERFRHLHLPALLLVGEASGPVHRDSVAALGATLPRARTVELPGQGHGALRAAPDLVADAIREFVQP